jgi:hypothetical protein
MLQSFDFKLSSQGLRVGLDAILKSKEFRKPYNCHDTLPSMSIIAALPES